MHFAKWGNSLALRVPAAENGKFAAAAVEPAAKLW
jgi:antitoxin component of MazEF toxin-antitoxin module